MKKIGGQTELVEDNLPEMKNEEIAEKLEQIWKLRDGAKLHDKLQGEAKEAIQGWVLGLPKKDQGIGKFKCGDFILSFKLEIAEVKPVKYKTKGGKKVRIKFAPDKEDDE